MPKKIYLVEDDEGIREMLGFVLASQYSVSAFENLQLYRLQMERALPDLVIMDIMLPDGNGDEAGKALLDDEATKNIPVLFMSANMKFELLSTAAHHNFIAKPFDIKNFHLKVKELIDPQP